MNLFNSIGIIGGADGPTAVFVSYNFPAFVWVIAAAAVAAALIIGAVLWMKRK